MKRISLVLVLGLCLSTSAYSSEEHSNSKEISKILKCSRKIIEQNRGGNEGIKFAASVIENASIEKNNKDALKTIKKVCRKFKGHHKKAKFIDLEHIAKAIDSLNFSEATKDIIKPFNRPYYECKFRNIEAHIAIGVGVGAGLGAAKCEGTNGRRYILLIPQASFNVGFVAGVFSRGGAISDENRLIGLAADDGYLAVGYFLGGLFDMSAEFDQIGTGAGLGLSLGASGQLRFKAIPLKNKFASMIERM